jgi:hypothetical protein
MVTCNKRLVPCQLSYKHGSDQRQVPSILDLCTHETSTDADTHHAHVCKPYPYKHLRKTVLAHLEIDEVTACASLSTGMYHTTESTTPLNLEINPGKYDYPC